MRMPIHRMRRHVTAMRGGFKPAARNFSRNLQRQICVHRLASESAEKVVSGSFRSGIQRAAVTSPSRCGLAIGTEDYVSVPKPAQLSGTSLEIPAATTVRPQCLIPTFLMNMAAKLQMGHLARVMLAREGDLRNDQF